MAFSCPLAEAVHQRLAPIPSSFADPLTEAPLRGFGL